MDLTALVESGRRVEKLVLGAAVGREIESAVHDLASRGEWRLLGEILLTASEVSGNRILDCLFENEQYDVVALAACLRRQLARRGLAQRRVGASRRVFRDFDETDTDARIPADVLAEAEEISQLADRSREAAARREAELDRDPMRDRMVARLGDALVKSRAALEALLVVVRASAFEDTRRGAALRVANHPASVRALAEAGRTADLLAVAEAAGLDSVSQNIAGAMTDPSAAKIKASDTAVVAFLAKHHPDEAVRQKAKETLERQ
jgi:hypothetical protein